MSHKQDPAHSGGYLLRLGERGRLVLPAALRRQLSLQTNDRLLATVESDGSLRLTSAREAARRARGLLRRLDASPRDGLLSEELIAERRRDAARE
jgi:bifunctional DNA-binding transcriptional regulator/antitoxin component of YhaV-PrlF toxin-antitoxin module